MYDSFEDAILLGSFFFLFMWHCDSAFSASCSLVPFSQPFINSSSSVCSLNDSLPRRSILSFVFDSLLTKYHVYADGQQSVTSSDLIPSKYIALWMPCEHRELPRPKLIHSLPLLQTCLSLTSVWVITVHHASKIGTWNLPHYPNQLITSCWFHLFISSQIDFLLLFILKALFSGPPHF